MQKPAILTGLLVVAITGSTIVLSDQLCGDVVGPYTCGSPADPNDSG